MRGGIGVADGRFRINAPLGAAGRDGDADRDADEDLMLVGVQGADHGVIGPLGDDDLDVVQVAEQHCDRSVPPPCPAGGDLEAIDEKGAVQEPVSES